MDPQAPVEQVTIVPFPHLGSYFCATVSITHVDGTSHEMFFKDLSLPFRAKDDVSGRRDRELHVYEDLLAGGRLGTAELIHTHRDPEADRCWLFLERLEGTTIEDPNDELGLEAAAWLGQLQSHFLPHVERLSRDEYLVQHNAAFFSAQLDRAKHEVAASVPSSADTFAKLFGSYDAVIELLADQPCNLVHGGYIPWHVIVNRSLDPVRVMAIDWELAAVGSPLYDLAYFTDGAEIGAQDRMYAAYRSAAIENGVPVVSDGEMRRIMDAFRLHRTVEWLSHSVAREFSEKKVAKLIARAARLMEMVDA